MSGSRTCSHCGSSEIDIDLGRGDAVCTNCGSVLEENAIVSEVQFEENAHGGSSAIGQFVAADSKGGGTSTIPGFRSGDRKASTEITLKNAKTRISNLASQLRLNQHCVSIACNFFKMALSSRLTCGRRSSHVVAACLYITCRTEGTPHMLIDFSDALQVDPYELGRTYVRLANAMSINIPTLDPCLYILRFANKLEFGDKTHEVSMTALRVVQRMKRDWMDTGRRPAGLCGAALLIASRLHDFSRTIHDIVNVVKVRQATLKKRLLEFGETPSSSLTSHEFMQIDLEEEQDPPCFKTARKKDKEKLQKLYAQDSDVDKEFMSLSVEIDKVLEKKERGGSTNRKEKQNKGNKIIAKEETPNEDQITRNFIAQDSMNTALEYANVTQDLKSTHKFAIPAISASSEDREASFNQSEEAQAAFNSEEVDGTPIDDDEIDAYILSENEVRIKTKAWMEMHGEFLKEQEEKRVKIEQEEKEGKVDKKKKKRKKREHFQAHNTGEAIEKMLAEKKISSKINYDVLRSLNKTTEDDKQEVATVREEKRLKIEEPVEVSKYQSTAEVTQAPEEDDVEDYWEEEPDEEPLSAAQLLSQHQEEFEYL